MGEISYSEQKVSTSLRWPTGARKQSHHDILIRNALWCWMLTEFFPVIMYPGIMEKLEKRAGDGEGSEWVALVLIKLSHV